jgi:hypothetical protein
MGKALVGWMAAVLAMGAAHASDHLDTPTVIANPQADIGDIYAWMAPDGQRLDLVMDIVGHGFSDRLDYVFHIDSGPRHGKTTATVTITCRFPEPGRADCKGAPGLQIFAGPRDDPFFNNVKGTRAAYQVAASALEAGARKDAAGCPMLDPGAVAALRERWRHTDGGPATNFLAGWPTSALVLSVDRAAAAKGGPLLAVWGATAMAEKQLDRVGRPLTKNALLGLFAPEADSDALKEAYNLDTPAEAARYVAEIEKSLALYDGFDGRCGNQLLAGPRAESGRYHALAELLADDRLWIDSRERSCCHFLAVERGLADDCGGRPPSMSAANAFRSLLVNGGDSGTDDGLERDEQPVSDQNFPFLAPPVAGK